jgi:hypothetical protein
LISRHRIAALSLLALLACGFSVAREQGSGAGKIVAVTNTLDVARPEAVLELSLADILSQTRIKDPKRIAVEDQVTQRILPVQLFSTTGTGDPDRLLVLLSIGAKQTIRLAFHESQDNAPTKPLVYGRLVPDRKDDFAWENDKVAYRVYGPALQANGEIASGIDVWSKRVPALIIDDWYKRDAEGTRTKNPALTYHKDDGTGLDSYDVGPTRGCGGTAVWSNGKLYPSKNFITAKVLATGPLRFSFELAYATWNAGGVTISEKKKITLDAGSHLNRIESTFSFTGAQSVEIAVGVAMHKAARFAAPVEGRILSIWEPLTDAGTGYDGTAVIMPLGHESAIVKAEGNAFFELNANSNQSLIYYAGAGWSKSDMPTQKAWIEYLRESLAEQEHPLVTHWQ